jgi:spore coat protein U-like protein
MSRKRLGSLAAILAGMAASSPVHAVSTATGNLEVTANVVPTCRIVSTGVLDFGSFMRGASTIDAVANLIVRCSYGASFSVSIDAGRSPEGGQRRMKHDTGTEALVYTVSQDAGHATTWGSGASAKPAVGTGADQTLAIYGRLQPPAEDATQTRPGNYADTLTITVEY